MRMIRRTSHFEKDIKRLEKRGKTFDVFKTIIEKITKGENLEAKYRDHQLIGAYQGARECHIEPDWLLIYEITKDEIILIRTGAHSDLFG